MEEIERKICLQTLGQSSNLFLRGLFLLASENKRFPLTELMSCLTEYTERDV